MDTTGLAYLRVSLAATLSITLLTFLPVTCAQESTLLGTSIVKPEAKADLSDVKRSRSRFALNRDAVRFGLVQGGAELFDGLTTRYFENHCAICVESDPVSRPLLGRRPGWPRMIGYGALEGVATAYIYQAMHRSSNRWLRGLAPYLPISITVVHASQATSNLLTIPSHRLGWQPRRRRN